MNKPTHVLCTCRALTEIDRDLSLMDCARCGSTSVDLMCVVACPTDCGHGKVRGCSLPFHDYERDVHVVPWEQRHLLVVD